MKSQRCLIFIILIIIHVSLLSTAELSDINVRESEFFVKAYLDTYYTLVMLQNAYDKDLFYLYNKSLFIEIIQTEKNDTAYIFNIMDTNESINIRWELRTTNKSISDELYHGFMMLDGITGVMYNITINNVNYPLIIQTNRESNNPLSATALAYEEFLIEYNNIYRNVLIHYIENKIGFEVSNEDYQELIKHKFLMDERTDDGTYINNFNLLRQDRNHLKELAQKYGISDEELNYIKNINAQKKELFGIEYTNNLYYSIFFLGTIILIYLLRYILRFTKKFGAIRPIIEQVIGYLSYPIIFILYYENRPYDYTNIQILIFIVVSIPIYIKSLKDRD